jgi:geranylgeranyl diphosphate synthase type I
MKLTEKGFSKEISLKASRLLANRSLQMIQGQYLDISFEERLNVSSREYKKMIAHKTGALISCAMELGAITASSKRNLSSLLGKVGWYFGYMFQLKDDVLGVWGDESITGKAQGSDIQRKKKTYPILYALRNAPVKQKTTLHKIFRKQSLSDEDVSYTMCVLEDMKIREKTAALVQEMSTEAMRLIAGAPIPPKTMNEFSDIVNYLLEREK